MRANPTRWNALAVTLVIGTCPQAGFDGWAPPGRLDDASPRAGWERSALPPNEGASDLPVLFTDDFEGDGSSFFEVEGFEREPGSGVDGSRGLSATIERGEQNAGSAKLGIGAVPDAYLAGVGDPATAYDDLEYEFDVRVQGSRGMPYKLVRSAVLARADWSEAAVAHAWGSPNLRQIRGDPATGVEGSSVAASGYNDFEAFRWLGQMPGGVVADGAWHRVRIRQALNTLGRRDGLFEIEVDGELVRRDDLDWRGRYSGYGWNVIFFEAYYNGGAPNDIEVTFDNLVVRGEGARYEPVVDAESGAAEVSEVPDESGSGEVPDDPDDRDDRGAESPDVSPSGAWYEQRWDAPDLGALLAQPGIDRIEYEPSYVSLIDDADGPGFDRALRVTFPPSGGSNTAGINVYFPRAGQDRPKEIWFEYYARHSDNWTTEGPGPGSAGHKHLFLFDQEETSAGRWEVMAGTFGSQTYMQIAGGRGSGANAPVHTPWDGEWRLYRCHARMHQIRGAWECWVDGRHFTWGRGNTDRKQGLYFNQIALSRNSNRGVAEVMTLDFGPLFVYTTDPGW